jgi:hypothetical protein
VLLLADRRFDEGTLGEIAGVQAITISYRGPFARVAVR